MIVKTLDVFCDICKLAWTHGGINCSAAEARRVAKGQKWSRKNGNDFCPICREKK